MSNVCETDMYTNCHYHFQVISKGLCDRYLLFTLLSFSGAKALLKHLPPFLCNTLINKYVI